MFENDSVSNIVFNNNNNCFKKLWHVDVPLRSNLYEGSGKGKLVEDVLLNISF